jgi:lactate dehydrogenase-like 2-hydroxyacid dehydrogenase
MAQKQYFDGVSMNVVMIDAANLNEDAYFPSLNLKKFGWVQYLNLTPNDVEEAVWRCDVIVAARAPVDQAMLDKAFKLRLIVAAGEATDHIDKAAAAERGIKVCNVPGRDPSNPEDEKKICREVVSAINAFIKEEDYNRVA